MTSYIIEEGMSMSQLVLISFGYRKCSPRSGSSHYTFRKDGKMPITIPKKRPIKEVYVRKVKEIIEGEIKDVES